MRRTTRTRAPALTLTLTLTLALWAAPAAAGDFKERLDKGEIIVYTRPVKGSETPAIWLKGVVNAPPRKVWDVVRRCANYHRSMPRIAASVQIRQAGNKFYCRVTADMPFPYSDITSVTEATHTEGQDRFTRRWRLISGDYTANSGAWELSPYKGDPKRTYVVYHIHAVPKPYIPGWIREKAQKSSMPKMIEQLRVLVR